MTGSRFQAAALAGLLSAIFLAGCTIRTNESTDSSGKKKEDVDIRTPFGSLSVKNGKSADLKDTGLPLYPGARPKEGKPGEDEGANVNISSSMFGLKVVAQEFQSGDAPDKILSFYRKQLGKFGKVVQCAGSDSNLSAHKDDKNAPVSCDGDSDGSEHEQELKVGTQGNQHVVSVKPKGGGSEFALVYVRITGDKDTL